MLLEPLSWVCLWSLWLILNTVLKDFEVDSILYFSSCKFKAKLEAAGATV